MKNLLLDILMKIVKYPDEVEVKEIDDEENIVYEIYVNPEDVGQIIVKDGRTIKSINIIMNAAKKRTR
jgi:predicted RNA-binding protein YlqC (UPF0109 family)